MRTSRVITVLAAVAASALAFAPFLSLPIDAGRLADFSGDQPAAYWFGRAAVLLLAGAAAVATRSIRIATGLAMLAVAAIAVSMTVPALRTVGSVGWVQYAPLPPQLAQLHAFPMWGVEALLALATLTAGALIVDSTRAGGRQSTGRTATAGFLATAAFAAAVTLINRGPDASSGEPRRYTDYLPAEPGSSFSWRGWLAITSAALVLLAAIAAWRPDGREAVGNSTFPS